MYGNFPQLCRSNIFHLKLSSLVKLTISKICRGRQILESQGTSPTRLLLCFCQFPSNKNKCQMHKNSMKQSKVIDTLWTYQILEVAAEPSSRETSMVTQGRSASQNRHTIVGFQVLYILRSCLYFRE